ncbi:HEAT repeat protein [Vulgatibacter incomptus]|uniref:HEAT repeat protein n=2 Tax=Vulgatibacter incomptus TaxID=1391653 RepID=A0A0K1PAH6_9BACT|nr:HEAT repeat protein [Vulgatibacter incomptus]
MVKVRVEALDLLAERGTEADLPALGKAARDPAPEVRRAAALAIGRRQASAASDLLGELLADPDGTVQAMAVAGLARAKGPKARAHLLAAYGRRPPEVRAAILAALEGKGMSAAEVIHAEAERIWSRNFEALRRGGPGERVGAAEELGRSGRPAVVRLLGPILADDSAMVAAGAARGLGMAGDPAAVPLLLALLQDQSPPVRESAVSALGRLADPAALEALAELARSRTHIASVASQALVRIPGSGDSSCAAALVSSSPEDAALLASHARAEGAVCDPAPLAVVIAKGGAAAVPAIAVARELGARQLVPSILALAQDGKEDLPTRLAAIEGVGALGDEKDRQALRPIAAAEVDVAPGEGVDPSPAAGDDGSAPTGGGAAGVVPVDGRLDDLLRKVGANRSAAAQERGDDGSAAAELRSAGERLRAAALRAIEGAPGTTPARVSQAATQPANARARLFDERPEARSGAARRLAETPDQEARRMLAALAAEDYYREVRVAAAAALEKLGPEPAAAP